MNPDDLIRRADAKAAIREAILAAFETWDGSFVDDEVNRRLFRDHAEQRAAKALDSVPAADGRWESGIIKRRIDVLRELIGKRVPGEHSIAEIELDALVDLLESVDADLTSRPAAKE